MGFPHIHTTDKCLMITFHIVEMISWSSYNKHQWQHKGCPDRRIVQLLDKRLTVLGKPQFQSGAFRHFCHRFCIFFRVMVASGILTHFRCASWNNVYYLNYFVVDLSPSLLFYCTHLWPVSEKDLSSGWTLWLVLCFPLLGLPVRVWLLFLRQLKFGL